MNIWNVSIIAAWILVSAQAITLISLLWIVGRIHLETSIETHVLETDEGPTIDNLLPRIIGTRINGSVFDSNFMIGNQWVALFLSAGCSPCEQLLRELREVQKQLPGSTELIVVLESSGQVANEYAKKYLSYQAQIVVDTSAKIRSELFIDRTPFGIYIDGNGIVNMKGVINTGQQINGLISGRGMSDGYGSWISSIKA